MTSQHKLSESLKSIAGAALVGLGLHILSGNLDEAATQLSHPLGTSAADALGVLPSVAMAASQAAQAYASNHQGFLLDAASDVGVILAAASRHCGNHACCGTLSTDKVKALPALPKKYFQNKDRDVDFAAPRSTLDRAQVQPVKESGTRLPTNTIRRSNDAIHDDRQARRESGPSAQGADGCHCEARRRGGESRHDAGERRPGANRAGRPRPAFRRPVTVTDGPFTEAKEVVGGYAQFELKSKEEAVKSAVRFMELHKKHWPGWEGETEVRQMFGPEESSAIGAGLRA